MGTASTFHVESRNGEAFLNFSAYLGPPRNIHFFQKDKPKTKSERKTQRDNERAAMYREKQNQSSNNTASTPVLRLKENVIDDANDVNNRIDETANSTLFDSNSGEESPVLTESTVAADGLNEVHDNSDVLVNDDQDVLTGDNTTSASSLETRADSAKSDDKHKKTPVPSIRKLSIAGDSDIDPFESNLSVAKEHALVKRGYNYHCEHGTPSCNQCMASGRYFLRKPK